jgi:TonB family protein
MTPEIHKRVRALFEEALEWPDAERVSRLQSACGGEPAVFDAVERLLGAHRDRDSFLQDPTHAIQRIGRYVVTGELGRGAMGVVYDALDPMIGRKVAVKVIRLQEFTDAAEARFLRERLFREARSAGVLSHPGIVTVFDVGEEGASAFIAMERVEGVSLDLALASGRRFSHEETMHVMRQVAAALDYAHWNGVVHRDVKPANIMVDHWMNVKIADFGVAKVASLHSQTLSGTVVGTPIYMSPEQIEAQVSDGRADQFSLAVIAYELLTGRRPFYADTLPALAHMIVYSARPSARSVNPELPAAVDGILHRGLARFPNERYSTCGEFVAAIDEALKVPGAPPPHMPAPSRKLPISEGQRHGGESSVKRRILIAAAAAVLLAISLLYILRPTKGPEAVKPDPQKSSSSGIPKAKSRIKPVGDAMRSRNSAVKEPVLPKSAESRPVPDVRPEVPLVPRPSGDPEDQAVSGLTSIRDVRPTYSAIAAKLHVEGSVRLKMVVMRDGRISNVTVMRPLGYGLDESAAQAAKQWLYIPRKRDGVPVMATLNVEEYFYLNVKTPGMWLTGPMAFKLDIGVTAPVIKDGEPPKADGEAANESVVMEFIVDAGGAVRNVQLVNGPESLATPLTHCLETWKFQPATRGARPVEAIGRVRFIRGSGGENVGKPLFANQPRLTSH